MSEQKKEPKPFEAQPGKLKLTGTYTPPPEKVEKPAEKEEAE